MQADVFSMNLTVHQQLKYTALLRLKGSKQQKMARVDEVIESLGLEKCRNSKLRAVSGGELKRCNIATELLTDPTLLLLDEPTSGLDSTAAEALMKVLRDLAKEGMTILACIHQPSSPIFQSFDKLLLLAEGQQMYFGPPSLASQHFAQCGFQCPEQYNPADYIMDIVSKPTSRDVMAKAYQEHHANNDSPIVVANASPVEEGKKGNKYAVSWSTQTKVLLERAMLDSSVNLFTWLNLLQTIGLAIICGTVWWQLPSSESRFQDKMSLLFFLMMFWPMNAQFEALQEVPTERPILVKERNAGSYNLSAYFTSITLASAPLNLILPTLNISLIYFACGLYLNASHFFGFLFSELLAVLAVRSMGHLIGICVTDLKKGFTAGLLINMLFMLVGWSHRRCT